MVGSPIGITAYIVACVTAPVKARYHLP